MRLDTVLKAGSLAFSVAQDDTVRELLSMVHKGARRRGLIGAPIPNGGPKSAGSGQNQKGASHPIPFSPESETASSASSASAPAKTSAKAPGPSSSGTDWSQILNGQNAKKMLGLAGQVGQMLMK